MWSIFADEILTTDVLNKNRYLRFTPNDNIVMRAMRTWFVLYNPPEFTNLKMNLYADRGGLPAGLITTSTNSWDKSDLITTQNYRAVEIYFEFPLTSLQSSLAYHFVMTASNYTYSAESHIAWRKAWPDPIYSQPTTFGALLRSPYIFALIGADL